MSITTRADSTLQTIPKGVSNQYVKLAFDGQTEFPTDAGRTLVVLWVSSDDFPHKVTAERLKKTMIDAINGSTEWNKAVEAALVFLLDPPVIKIRSDRHMDGAESDWTERVAIAIPLVSDLGLVYVAEFECKDEMLVSVEMAKDPSKAMPLNYREIKIVTIEPRQVYR